MKYIITYSIPGPHGGPIVFSGDSIRSLEVEEEDKDYMVEKLRENNIQVRSIDIKNDPS